HKRAISSRRSAIKHCRCRKRRARSRVLHVAAALSPAWLSATIEDYIFPLTNPDPRMADDVVNTRFIFVTGGVVSSLGKGIAAASLGALLEARGLTVSVIKLDPYLNVYAGTMSPFQDGEV